MLLLQACTDCNEQCHAHLGARVCVGAYRPFGEVSLEEIQRLQLSHPEQYSEQQVKELAAYVRKRDHAVQTATGRNQPCLCGSGKKFKRCHGRSQ